MYFYGAKIVIKIRYHHYWVSNLLQVNFISQKGEWQNTKLWG